MTRREILDFYKNLINGLVVNNKPVRAHTTIVLPTDADSHTFSVLAQQESIALGLYSEMMSRTIQIVISGFVHGSDLFVEAEDVVEAIVNKVTDKNNYVTCAFGPASLLVTVEASELVDFVAHVQIRLTVEFVTE